MWKTYRKIALVKAVQMEVPFVVETLVKNGDR